MPLVPLAQCLTSSCVSRPAAGCRGLCMKCYSEAKKLVESGGSTWAELESLGMVQSEKSKFAAALESKRRGCLPEGP